MSMSSSTTQRLITGAILIGVGLTTIAFGGLLLFFWVLFVTLAGTWEMISLYRRSGVRPFEWVIYPVILAVLLSTLIPQTHWIWSHAAMKVAVITVLGGSTIELLLKTVWIPMSRAMVSLKIISFSAITFPFIYLVREGKNGLLMMLFGCVIIWTTDSTAWFFGRKFGKTKLAPTISPNKSVEGAIAGIVGAVVFAVGFCVVFKLAMLKFIPAAALLSVIGQLGDLHESLLKRRFNVKDSSQIFPGHGGVYDRADSTLFCLPIIGIR